MNIPPETAPVVTASPDRSQLRGRSMKMASGVLLSRVSGLVREQVMAYLFGASIAMEAFVAAFRIPNLLRDMFAENVSTSAVLPMYAKVREKEGSRTAAEYAGAMLAFLAVATTAVVTLGIAFAPQITSLVASGFVGDPARFELTVLLTRWMFPFLILISIAAFLQAIQNAEGRFFVPAVSTAALNIGMIVVGFGLSRVIDPPILGMAIGVLAGGVLTILMLLPGYIRSIRGFSLRKFWGRGDVVETLSIAVPVMFGAAATNVNLLVNTIVATFAESGALAYLNYAYRIMFLPLGLIAVSLSTVALSSLSAQFHSGKEKEFSGTLSNALVFGIKLAIPAAAGLMVLRTDIVGVLFNYGNFGEEALRNTAAALAAYSAGVPAFALNRVFSAGFYSRNAPKIAVRIGVIGVISNIILNVLAIVLGFGFVGIAAAAAIAGWIQTVLHVFAVRRHIKQVSFIKLIAPSMATVAATVIMVTALFAAVPYLTEIRLVRVPLELIVGATAYFAALAIFETSRGASIFPK